MSKYKININKPEPSDEVINESKDFGKFLDTYSELHQPHKVIKTIHRNKRLIRLAILFIVVLLALLFSNNYFETDSEKIEVQHSTKHNTETAPK